MELQVVAIAMRQLRGLHAGKVTELADSILAAGFLLSSMLTVQSMMDGTFLLVDGMHRLTAVLYLISVGKLAKDYTIRCIVLRAETPNSWILRYSYLVNLANDATAKVTFVDKMRWSLTYLVSILPQWVAASTKAVSKNTYCWYDVSASYLVKSIQGSKSQPVKCFTLGPVQRLMGVLRAIRTDSTFDETGPLLFQPASAWTEMLMFDQLGQIGITAWYTNYQFSYVLANAKPNKKAPGGKSGKKGDGPWEAPVLLKESTCYPSVFTDTKDKGMKMSREESNLPFGDARCKCMMRLYMGHLARTGTKMTLLEGQKWAEMFEENPRIVVLTNTSLNFCRFRGK